MYLLPDQTSVHDLDLSFTRPHLIKDFAYRGSCNGLMCLSENSNIVICNPATRECRLPPQPPYHTWDIKFVGFAFDSKTNDYIVIRFASMRQTTCVDHKIHIYSISADSWKEITTTVPCSFTATYRYFQPCTFLDGAFYWLSYDFSTCVRLIDAFNTVEGLFERRSMPAGLSFEGQIDLCLLNDYPALIQQNYDNQRGETRFEVWLMDKYGV
ncbi:hypothetical protein RHMOL_Rhmol10G0070300 [Rhododendron molle]|uniref:Uncharacterized protein n=1 Tax=Rhododendron molle TaxID=49168 RepID=A0ACC0LZH3_RHOML|nr:hypothetical protein RHMOL_Rhmol10G0070300 [Rhododendron molle]